MPIRLFSLLTLFLPSLLFSQSDYARNVLNKLCSPEMHGRGYVYGGDSLAANYIKDQYEIIGLKPFGESFFQEFTTPVNTIIGNPSVTIEDETLKAGVQFIVWPNCPTISMEEAEVVFLSKKAFSDNNLLHRELRAASGKVLVLDRRRISEKDYKETAKRVRPIISMILQDKKLSLAGIVDIKREDEKLVWSGSQSVGSMPIIELSSDVPDKFKTISLDVTNRFHKSYNTRNVIGYLPGENQSKYIVLTAHYDHLGRMGDSTYFPGASDNASGVAMLLSLAKSFAKTNQKRPYNIVFMCFAAEEIGIVGSKYYTDNPLFPLHKIQFLLNLDIMGTGDDGIQVVNGTVYKDQFRLLQAINEEEGYLKKVKIRGERCNSDHCYFHEKMVPSFFSYTLGGKAEYHNIYDTSESLSLSEFDNVHALFVQFISELSSGRVR